MFYAKILGTSSATPAFGRLPSAQVVSYADRYYLVDCGEGTQMQLLRNRIRYARIDAIFISHLHGDHILGLPGLLSSMNMFERHRPMPIFAPAALKQIIEAFYQYSETYLRYEVEFHPLEDFEVGDVIYSTDKMEVRLLPLEHRIFCRGFLFKEKNKRRKFDFYKAKSLEVPKEYFHILKQEKDVELLDGKVIRADDVLLPREEPLSYAYCSDTCYNEALIPHLENTTLLYHEATFMENMHKRALETFHSTASQAGRIAKSAKVKKLLIGHYSARYKDLSPLLEEARQVFPNTELALEGRQFDIVHGA